MLTVNDMLIDSITHVFELSEEYSSLLKDYSEYADELAHCPFSARRAKLSELLGETAEKLRECRLEFKDPRDIFRCLEDLSNAGDALRARRLLRRAARADLIWNVAAVRDMSDEVISAYQSADDAVVAAGC
jgi:hypothetical protein